MADIGGREIYELAASLFPLCRSITGDGVRETLGILGRYVENSCGAKLNVHEIPSGTKVFDWTVPKEWEIRAAYIENEAGERIVDMARHNLHVLGYSTPVDRWVEME